MAERINEIKEVVHNISSFLLNKSGVAWVIGTDSEGNECSELLTTGMVVTRDESIAFAVGYQVPFVEVNRGRGNIVIAARRNLQNIP